MASVGAIHPRIPFAFCEPMEFTETTACTDLGSHPPQGDLTMHV